MKQRFEEPRPSEPRDLAEKAQRRAMVMAEAKTSQKVKEDPRGVHFHAAQQAAIADRRVDNLRLHEEHAADPEFSESQLRRWAEPVTRTKKVRSMANGLVIALLASIALLAFWSWYPELARLIGH